jgi:hypothetical protein
VEITYFAFYIGPRNQLQALSDLPRKQLSMSLSVPQSQSGYGDEKKNSCSQHLPVSNCRDVGVILTHSRSHY